MGILSSIFSLKFNLFKKFWFNRELKKVKLKSLNEINYKDSPGFEVKDWVELYNNSDISVDISGWVFKDSDDLHEFIIPSGTVMPAGSYIVLAQSLADFQTYYPDVSPVLGDFEFGLSDHAPSIRCYRSAARCASACSSGTARPHSAGAGP